MTIQRCLLVFLLALLASGCKKKDYDYYMQDPDDLRRAVMHCISLPDSSTDPTCQVVAQAQNDFESNMNIARTDPQGYGKLILAAETQLGSMRQTVESLHASNAIDQVKLDLAEHASREQAIKVAIMLNIVAVSTWQGL